jgi:beta-exotoxin I transport system permease protein
MSLATRVPPVPAAVDGWRRPLRVLSVRGIRDLARAPLTWGGGLGVMGGLIAALWPSIEDSVDELVRSYPENLKEAFGIRELTSVELYVDAEMLSLIVPLVVGYFAVRSIAAATVGAESRGHLDMLLSLPVRRRTVIAGAFVSTAVAVAGVLAVFWALTLVAGTLAGTGISATVLGRGALNVWPLAMVFAGLAALLAGVLHRPGAVSGIAAGTLVGMYVVDLVGKLSHSLEPVRAVSPFRYYGSAIQDGVDLSHFVALTAVAVLLATAGALLFERRDVL